MTRVLDEPTRMIPAPVAAPTVPCVYCREPIASTTLAYWSAAKRLLSADCPTCQRRVTLAAATWRRWIREYGASVATT
jgi:endogenous inhibitor of DNA gyrase (YacG/DUF329 family)